MTQFSNLAANGQLRPIGFGSMQGRNIAENFG